ncbi:MAG: pentapeptide repeat-containing protein [Rubrobacter sp.]
MERERSPRQSASRVFLLVAVVVLVLFAVDSALDIEGMSSDVVVDTPEAREAGPQGEASRDLVALLIIPLTLAVVGYAYTSYETRRTQAIERARSEEERISKFLDEMNELIFEHDLRDSLSGTDVRRIARTRILTVLLNMNRDRKRRPLKAVYELDLVSRARPILSLDQADLDRAVLSEAVLPGIDLRGVYLRHADLSGARLSGADLSGAYLKDANLNRANLSRANLRGAEVTREQLDQARSLEGTIMPDGSTHP